LYAEGMKKVILILVAGLLLSGCGSSGSLSMFKKEILIKDDYPRNELKNIIYNSARSEDGFRFKEILFYTNEEGDFDIVRPKDFDKDSTYSVASIKLYEKAKEFSDFKYTSLSKFEMDDLILYFRTYGPTEEKAEDNLISKCEEYKKKNNLYIDCSSSISTRPTTLGKRLENYEGMYLYAKQKIKEGKRLKIEQAKINKEIQEKYKAKKLADNKKRCEEIGFTLQTESFAKCVLKLIELAEIRESALIESRSRASLEADMQQQQIDIQDQIAAEAKASRDQQAWGVLLGMTMGNNVLNPSSGGLFSPSAVSCYKTSETTSGTNKICYYNCMGSTKTINVGSMQFCPININK